MNKHHGWDLDFVEMIDQTINAIDGCIDCELKLQFFRENFTNQANWIT